MATVSRFRGSLYALAKWFVLLVVFFSLSCHATTIDDLLSSGRLTIHTNVNHQGIVSVKQPITLRIEVATDRWFSKGSRVGAFTMHDVVIPPVSELAINGSRKIQGQTWVTQTREILLYPMKAGRYQIPSLGVEVSVNSAEGVVEGRVMTSPVTFEVQLPEPLQGIEEFIVSPEASLEIEGMFDIDALYRVGGAVTQVITISAADTPAMMLPELPFSEIPGVSVYHKPSEVLSRSSRGDQLGIRRETRVYIFEEVGEFQLPQQIHYWWDTDDQVLKTLVVPPQKWMVERKAFSWKSLTTDLNWADYGKAIAGLGVILALLWQLFRHRQLLVSQFLMLSHYRERQLKKHFIQAVQQQDYKAACQWLYEFYRLPSDESDTLRSVFSTDKEQSVILEQLFSSAFSAEILGSSPATISLSEAKQLLHRSLPKSLDETGLSAGIRLN
ncbi:MAG: hypothetical protein CL693_03420 [Cellvibrionaceae bacterium]|nr:hypothetical protein [Cellvibrionaceae bacterium]|tara:strand:- start:16032 stop:17357 length:1326 start_codon:yes stop_codon:yes gene_type:complete